MACGGHIDFSILLFARGRIYCSKLNKSLDDPIVKPTPTVLRSLIVALALLAVGTRDFCVR
jgi:hypothetical protein